MSEEYNDQQRDEEQKAHTLQGIGRANILTESQRIRHYPEPTFEPKRKIYYSTKNTRFNDNDTERD